MKLPTFLLLALFPVLLFEQGTQKSLFSVPEFREAEGFFYQPPTLSPKKIEGKYGTAGQEFICLELRANQSFSLTISSCSADNYVEGKYKIEGEKIKLNSTLQPKMDLSYKKEFPTEKHKLKITSNESILLPRVGLEVDGKKRRLNEKGEVELEQKPKKITVRYADLPSATINISEQKEKGIKLDLQFENLAAASIKDQIWTYSKKKLTFIDEQGKSIILRKTTQCWFDYMEN